MHFLALMYSSFKFTIMLIYRFKGQSMNYNCKYNEDEYDGLNIYLPNKLVGKGDEVLLYEFNGLGYLIQISGNN